jgi:hypothetical protein
MDHISWYLKPGLGGLGLPKPLDGSKEDLTLTPYQVFRVRQFIENKQKRGVVQPYVAIDYKDLPGDMQIEAINQTFGGVFSDTFKSIIPVVPVATLKSAKVVGLGSDINVKITDGNRAWFLGQPTFMYSNDPSILAESVITSVSPIKVYESRKKDPNREPQFFYHKRMRRDFQCNRELGVWTLNLLNLETVSTKFSWNPPIPENMFFPELSPYRGLLEEIRVSRREQFGSAVFIQTDDWCAHVSGENMA